MESTTFVSLETTGSPSGTRNRVDENDIAEKAHSVIWPAPPEGPITPLKRKPFRSLFVASQGLVIPVHVSVAELQVSWSLTHSPMFPMMSRTPYFDTHRAVVVPPVRRALPLEAS